MNQHSKIFPLLLPVLLLSSPGQAFRNCGLDNSDAYVAATRYVVGEIGFDGESGTASGTETSYNYSNIAGAGSGECHVTYEMSGSYDVGSALLLLEATRSNHSRGCPAEFIELEYPTSRFYSLHLLLESGGSAEVHLADSGELLANGTWHPGRIAYKTDEQCTVF